MNHDERAQAAADHRAMNSRLVVDGMCKHVGGYNTELSD
jgi:hypothetical protein